MPNSNSVRSDPKTYQKAIATNNNEKQPASKFKDPKIKEYTQTQEHGDSSTSRKRYLKGEPPFNEVKGEDLTKELKNSGNKATG